MNAAQLRQHRMKLLEEFRSNSLKFGGPIGFVVSRSFDLCETVVRDGVDNLEAVAYALESLEREREYALSKDQALNDPLRGIIYNITQAISAMVESVLDEARARQGKALIAPVETPASSTSDFNVAGGSASVSPVQKMAVVKQEIITIEDAPGTSQKEEAKTEPPLYMAPPAAQPPRQVHFSQSPATQIPPTPQALRKSVISVVHPTKSASPAKSTSTAAQPVPVVKQQSPVTATPSATPSPDPAAVEKSPEVPITPKRPSPAEEKPATTDADVPRPPKRKCTSSFYGYYEEDEESRSPTIPPATALAITQALAAAVPFSLHQCDKCDKSFDSLKGLKRHRFNHIAIKCSSCHRFVAKEKIDAHMERHGASKIDSRDAMHSDDFEGVESDLDDDKDYRPAGVSAKPRSSTLQKRTEKPGKTEAPASPEAVIPADPVARKRPSPVPVPPPPPKDHICGQCGKGFETVGKLATHELMHNDELDERFPCPHCKISRPKKSILYHHIRVDHGINPYDCRTCGETFAKKAHLKEHSIKEGHGKYAKQGQPVHPQVQPVAQPQVQPKAVEKIVDPQPKPQAVQAVVLPVEAQPKPQAEPRTETVSVELIKVPIIMQPVA